MLLTSRDYLDLPGGFEAIQMLPTLLYQSGSAPETSIAGAVLLERALKGGVEHYKKDLQVKQPARLCMAVVAPPRLQRPVCTAPCAQAQGLTASKIAQPSGFRGSLPGLKSSKICWIAARAACWR